MVLISSALYFRIALFQPRQPSLRQRNPAVVLLSVPVRDDALAHLICALAEVRAEVVDGRRSLFAEPFERVIHIHARESTTFMR